MAQDQHGEKITFRLDPELKAQLEEVMRARGIKKISDFARQAVASQILKVKTEIEIEAHKLALAKQVLEEKARGIEPIPFNYGLGMVAEDPAPYGQKKPQAKPGSARPAVPIPKPRATG